ncbi:MAG: DUF3857 domain-containing protein [Vulcanimicrobiota bacterium]
MMQPFLRWGTIALLTVMMAAGAGAQPGKSLLRVDNRFLDSPGSERYPQARALILLDDIEFNLSPDGSVDFSEHDAIKVLTEDGVKEQSELVRIYDSRLEGYELRAARVISADGAVSEVPKSEVSDEALFKSSQAYSAYRKFKVNFPGVKPGMVVEFDIVTHRKPRRDKAWWATSYVQNPSPILSSTFTARLPAGTPLNWSTPGLGRLEPEKATADGTDIYRWAVKDQLALEPEPSMPTVLQALNRIEISSFQDWKSVGQWIDQGWHLQVSPTSKVALKAAGLLPVGGTAHDRVQSILGWVEKEKEVVDFLNDDFFPRDPSLVVDEPVLANLDVASLLGAMLTFAGYQVEPVVTFPEPTNRQGDELPMPSKMDEVVLRVTDVAAHKTWWISPEHPGEVSLSPPSGFQGASALVLGRAEGLVDLERGEADENRQEVRVEARVDLNGRTEIGLWIGQYGDSGTLWREAARSLSEANRRVRERNLDNLFARLARSISPRAQVHDRYFDLAPDPGAGFDMSATLIIPGYVVKEGNEFALPLPVQSNERLRELLGQGLNRRYPIRFDHPFRDETRVHVLLPEGSTITALPPTVSIDTPAASFISHTRTANGEAWYYSRLTVKKPWVSIDELEPLLEVAKNMAESQQSMLKFTPPAGATTEIESEEDL